MKPWVNEPTPIVDAATMYTRGDSRMEDIARDLERRLRHAEGLLREHMEIHRADVSNDTRINKFLEWLSRRDAYFAAAKQDDK